MDITEQFRREIAPFFWVAQDTGASVCLEADGSYLQDLFETRAEEGFLGNGYDWESLARVFLEEVCPDLDGRIDFDSEAGMFCAFSEDQDALAEFIRQFKRACGDRDVIGGLFSRAELD